jgi:radical SAM protein with 4Fe4S-binding SPASM domain
MLKYSELSSVNRQNLRDIIPLEKPFTVFIEPTSVCNFRCVMCPHGDGKSADAYFSRNVGHMPMARFRHVLEQLAKWPGASLKALKLYMLGEPLANPDFPEMLRLAKAGCYAERIEVSTNGSLLNQKMAEHMVDVELDYLQISIYATEQARHREVTGSKLDIQRIQDNLACLQEIKKQRGKARPFVSCRMLETFDAWKNQHFQEIFGKIADETGLIGIHDWSQDDAGIFSSRLYGNDVAPVTILGAKTPARRYACCFPFTTMVVRANGDVQVCCVEHRGHTVLGNIETQSLREIWEGETWRAFQRMQLENRRYENPSCANCTSFYEKPDNIDGVSVERLNENHEHARRFS